MRGIGLLLALLLLGGCAGQGGDRAVSEAPESTALSLPPRPRDLRINGVEPCSLLTEQQRAELGLDGISSSGIEPSALFGGDETSCVISGFTPRAVFVGVGLVTTVGIELFTSRELEASMTILKIRGFPAVRAVPRRFTKFCTVVVDVAPGKMLDIQFSDGGRMPPIPQDELCRDAELVADATMRTLLDQVG